MRIDFYWKRGFPPLSGLLIMVIILCSLFLFNFEAKRCYARSFVTNSGKIGKYSKEFYSNGTSYQGLRPRTPYQVMRYFGHVVPSV